jgi:hypothetical protein
MGQQLAKQLTSGERWEAVSRTSTGLILQGVLGKYMIVILT